MSSSSMTETSTGHAPAYSKVKGTIVFGLDPGVTRFGVVAIDDYQGYPVAWATFHSDGKAYGDLEQYHRVTALANEVVTWIRANTDGYKYVVIVIETPVYNRNAKNFQLQWRLFQQTLAWVRHVSHPDWFLEVSPGTVKKELTGSGSSKKLDMVLASHFDGPGIKKVDAEALADAEAIANCWYTQHTQAYSPSSKENACRVGPVVHGRRDNA